MTVMVVRVADNALAAFFAERMAARKLSAGMLAAQSGIAPATLTPILEGHRKRINVVNLYRLAAPLRVPFEDLCRLAVGLPVERTTTTGDPHRDRLMEIYDDLRGMEQEEFVRFVEQTVELMRRHGRDQRLPGQDAGVP